MPDRNGLDPRQRPPKQQPLILRPPGASGDRTNVQLGTQFDPHLQVTVCVLTVGTAQLTFPSEQAEMLGHQLMVLAARAKAETNLFRACLDRGQTAAEAIEMVATWRARMTDQPAPPQSHPRAP